MRNTKFIYLSGKRPLVKKPIKSVMIILIACLTINTVTRINASSGGNDEGSAGSFINSSSNMGPCESSGDEYNEILAQASTPLMNRSPNRLTNINLACGMVNETAVMPGDTFSFNQTVGDRTEARGFKKAFTFMDGGVGESVGGGICQVSSTLYCACLLADLDIVSRRGHSVFPDYAGNPGLDATVYWGEADYTFKNNTDYPIKVFAGSDGVFVYVRIMGTRMSDNVVVIESRILSTTPYETVYRNNPGLAPGQTKVIQDPHAGYVAETYRVILDECGGEISRTLEAKSVYKKLDKIIERGL